MARVQITLENLIGKLKIQEKRFPSKQLLHYEVLYAFFSERSSESVEGKLSVLTQDQFESIQQQQSLICAKSLDILAYVFKQHKLFLHERSDPFDSAAEDFVSLIRQFIYWICNGGSSNNNNDEENASSGEDSIVSQMLQRVDVEALWKLLSEELFWRLFGWDSWDSWATIEKKDTPASTGSRSSNNDNNKINNKSKNTTKHATAAASLPTTDANKDTTITTTTTTNNQEANSVSASPSGSETTTTDAAAYAATTESSTEEGSAEGAKTNNKVGETKDSKRERKRKAHAQYLASIHSKDNKNCTAYRKRENIFYMSRKGEDFVRFLIWGYHNAYEDFVQEWLQPLFKQMHEVKQLVLIDLDNVANAVQHLDANEFNWPGCLVYGFSGPDFAKNALVKKWAHTEQKLHIVKVDPAAKKLNKLEEYMQQFYHDSYYRKYKNAADFLLSAFGGIIHRVCDLDVRVWIISRDEDLEFPAKALVHRGRKASRIAEKRLVHNLNYHTTFLEYTPKDMLFLRQDVVEDKLDNEVTFDLTEVECEQCSSSQDKFNSIDNGAEYSCYTDKEMNSKLCETTTGAPFDRLIYEKEMARHITEMLKQDHDESVKKKQRNQLAWTEIRGRRFGVEISEVARGIATYIPALTCIDIRGTRLTDDGVEAFMNALARIDKVHSSIKMLDLGASLMGDRGAKAVARWLKDNRSCELLDLRWNKIGTKGAFALADALDVNTTLTALNLRKNNLDRAGIRALVSCYFNKSPASSSDLCFLDVRENSFTEDSAFVFNDLQQQQHQRSGHDGNNDNNNAQKALNLESLTALDMSSCGVHLGIKSLARHLAHPYSLVRLSLDYNRIGAAGAQLLAKALMTNKSLVGLTLARNDILDEGARAIAYSLKHNNTLTLLDLQNNGIGDEGACALAECLHYHNETLCSLNLNKNNIGSLGGAYLASMLQTNHTMTSVDLRKNEISWKGAEALAESIGRAPNVQLVDIRENKLGDKAMTKLAASILGHPALTWLDLEDSNIRNEGCKHLMYALESNKEVFYLNLNKNFIGFQGYLHSSQILKEWTDTPIHSHLVDGLQAIGSTLLLNTTLTYLNLSQNYISDEGIEVLCTQYLSKNPALVRLDLASNAITKEGARHLASMLATNHTLVGLWLKNNELGSEGLVALCQGLAKNTTLTALQLENNKIGDEGAAALGQVLGLPNSVLGAVDMPANSISDQGAQKLAEGVAASPALFQLNLERNALLTRTGANAIMEAASRHGVLSDIESCGITCVGIYL